jgi:hypothetical protein
MTYDHGIDEGGNAIVLGATKLCQVEGCALLLQGPHLQRTRCGCSLRSRGRGRRLGVGAIAETKGQLANWLALERDGARLTGRESPA